MNLADVTPLILTYNEQSNIRDTLSRLRWATRIVIIDSFSNDETLEIISEFSNVEVFYREFDHFAEQCNFGLTKVESPWVLSLDADYKCLPKLPDELNSLDATDAGYRSNFKYCIYGKPLRATLYPPRVVLYRKELAKYNRDGHAHKVAIDGEVGQLRTNILHDDWKPLSMWFGSQVKYADQEAMKLSEKRGDELGWKDRIRNWIVLAPVLTLFYCLFFKLLALDGWAGFYYTSQRVYAEVVLSLILLDRRLKKRALRPKESQNECTESK